MRLEYTKKLLDYLGVKPEKTAEPVGSVFQWSANLIVVNRRKRLVATHAASRSMFVTCRLKAKVRAKLPELIREGIRTLLQSEYVRPEIIERYLGAVGTIWRLGQTPHERPSQPASRPVHGCRQFSEPFHPGELYQTELLPELNKDMVQKKRTVSRMSF